MLAPLSTAPRSSRSVSILEICGVTRKRRAGGFRGGGRVGLFVAVSVFGVVIRVFWGFIAVGGLGVVKRGRVRRLIMKIGRVRIWGTARVFCVFGVFL